MRSLNFKISRAQKSETLQSTLECPSTIRFDLIPDGGRLEIANKFVVCSDRTYSAHYRKRGLERIFPMLELVPDRGLKRDEKSQDQDSVWARLEREFPGYAAYAHYFEGDGGNLEIVAVVTADFFARISQQLVAGALPSNVGISFDLRYTRARHADIQFERPSIIWNVP